MSADYMAPTLAEAQRDEYEANLPDCPPRPDTVCKHCGDILALHQTADPDDQPTPGDAVCIGDMGDAFLAGRAPQQFEPADGEDLDCAHRTVCDVCDVDICSEHSTEFVACATSWAVIHHWACRPSCTDCADAAADDIKARGF